MEVVKEIEELVTVKKLVIVERVLEKKKVVRRVI